MEPLTSNLRIRYRVDGMLMDIPVPEKSWLAVFRREYKVWRLPLDENQHAVLAAHECWPSFTPI